MACLLEKSRLVKFAGFADRHIVLWAAKIKRNQPVSRPV
jgi:hypothetical protein